MFIFKSGNLFDEINNVEAIINTVNCVGVMGKGIALEFKKRYPINLINYEKSCKNKELKPGKMLTVINDSNISPKYIINFPTKLHWKNPSKIEYIAQGLDALKLEIKKYSLKSIAMPALGCGNGGLDWNQVKPIIINKLSDLPDVKFYIYEPNVNKISSETKIKITKPRALLLLLIDHYNNSAFKQQVTYEEVNRLAFLAQSLGAKLNLNFKETRLGPYDTNLNKLLLALSKNEYIQIEKTSKNINYIQVNIKKFKQKKSTLKDIEIKKLYKNITELLSGFESEDRIKILTLAVWLYESEDINRSEDQLFSSLLRWNNKEDLDFSESTMNEAVRRVIKFNSSNNENISFDL